MSAPAPDALLAAPATAEKRGQAVPVGGGKAVQSKSLVGRAVACPSCSTEQVQVAAEIVDGGWSCWSCGSVGTPEQMLGNSRCVFRSGDNAGSPWIITPKGDVVRYGRASSHAKPLEDSYMLHRRDKRALIIGMLARPMSLLEVERAVADGLRIDDMDPDQKDELDELVEQAMDAGGVWMKARLGTLLHKVAECRDLGLEAPEFPAEHEVTLAARAMTLARYEVTWYARERFVVHDEQKVAGSFDGVGALTLPDDTRVPAHLRGTRGACVFDDKFGQTLDYSGLSYAAQQAVYEGGQLYNPATGDRVPLQSLIPEGSETPWCSDVAIILHQPAGGRASSLIPVPLVHARASMQHASDTLKMRTKGKAWLKPAGVCEVPDETATALEQQRAVRARLEQGDTAPEPDRTTTQAPVSITAPPDPLAQAIAEASTYEALTALWQANQPAWHDGYTELAKARRAVLAAGLSATSTATSAA